MAQTGYTPISLYYSTTASTAPSSGNLVDGELAINITDGKLYYKDNTGTVKVIAGAGGAGVAGGSNTQVQYNSSGSLAGSANMTFDGTTLTIAGLSNTGNTTLGNATTDTVTVNGYMGVGAAASSSIAVRIGSSALSGASQRGAFSDVTFTSASTTRGAAFESNPSTAVASFTVTDVMGFSAQNVAALGAGSTITNQHGVYVADQTRGTNNYGITSAVSSGSNKWNIYASGTADNYFSGNVGIGTSSPAAKLDVVGIVEVSSNIQSSGNPILYSYNGSTVGTVNAGIQLVGSGSNIRFTTGNTERMRIDSSGNVGVGKTAMTYPLDIAADSSGNGIRLTRSTTTEAAVYQNASGGTTLASTGSSAFLAFGTGTTVGSPTERMRINSSGNVMVGTTTARVVGQVIAGVQVSGDIDDSSISLSEYANDTSAPRLSFGKSRGTSDGSYTIVQSGDQLGAISFSGADGTDLATRGAEILAAVDGTPGANDMPGRLVFSTTADGASSPTERMRITSSGNIVVGGVGNGTSSPFASKIPTVDVETTGYAVIGARGYGTTASNGGVLVLGRSNSATLGTLTATTTGQYLGLIGFEGVNSSNAAQYAAYIQVAQEGTNGATYVPSNMTFSTGTNAAAPAERMRIDSSGNLGLGVTPSAWGSGIGKVVEVGATGNAVWGNGVDDLRLTSNIYYNAGYKYANTNQACMFTMGDSAFIWYTAPTGTAGNAVTLTQAMMLDASGNLGVGTTSPGASTKLNVSGRGLFTGGAADPSDSTSAGVAINYNSGGYLGSIQTGIAVNQMWLYGSPLIFGTSPTSERARIDSSGNLLVGTTSSTSTGLNNGGVVCTPTYAQICVGATSGTAAYFYTKGGGGSVVQAGTITVSTNTAAYNSGSDYRLKEQIEPLNNALNTVSLLKPSKWLWKSNGEYGNGFIAHELAEVCPQAVSGEKDAVDEEGNAIYQGVDTSFLVATLTAAIQELNAKFEEYKAAHP